MVSMFHKGLRDDQGLGFRMMRSRKPSEGFKSTDPTSDFHFLCPNKRAAAEQKGQSHFMIQNSEKWRTGKPQPRLMWLVCFVPSDCSVSVAIPLPRVSWHRVAEAGLVEILLEEWLLRPLKTLSSIRPTAEFYRLKHRLMDSPFQCRTRDLAFNIMYILSNFFCILLFNNLNYLLDRNDILLSFCFSFCLSVCLSVCMSACIFLFHFHFSLLFLSIHVSIPYPALDQALLVANQYVVSFDGILFQLPAMSCPVVLAQDRSQNPTFTLLLSPRRRRVMVYC